MKNIVIVLISFFIISLVAFIEYSSPPGIYIGAFYLLGILITFFSRPRIYPVIASLYSIILVLSGIFVFHSTEDFYLVTINQTATLAAILITMFFVLFMKTLETKSNEESRQMISLLENATEGIILTKSGGEIVFSNPHALNMFGYTREDLVGQSIDVLIPMRIRGKHAEHRQGFVQKPVNRMMGIGRDLFAVRKDGQEFPVEVSLSHYTINKQAYVIAFVIDISKRKQQESMMALQRAEIERKSEEVQALNTELENKVAARTSMLQETLAQLERSKEELKEALDKEKELSDLKSRFVSMASHEFRTPLSTILSSASLIGKYTSGEQQAQRDKHINRIKESIRHLNSMLEDLLSIGRLEEGKVLIRATEFQVCEFLSEMADELKLLANDGKQLKINCPDHLSIYTDKNLFRNILLNLISNAIKFSNENGEVILKADVYEDQFCISVSDSGIGISEEDMQYLFERFFRAKNAQNIQGTGLGLYIVSRYVQLLGGRIEVKSVLNQGTIFSVFLPLKIET